MDGRCFKYSGKEVVPEPFDLHILLADQAKVYKHI